MFFISGHVFFFYVLFSFIVKKKIQIKLINPIRILYVELKKKACYHFIIYLVVLKYLSCGVYLRYYSILCMIQPFSFFKCLTCDSPGKHPI